MIGKMSLRDRLDCLLDFARMIVFGLVPLPNCFSRVCFPTPLEAVLRDFLPLITTPISGAANSNLSAPTVLPLGRHIYAKRELQFSQ